MEFFEKGTKNDILYWSKRLYQKNMSPSKSGNISLKTPDGILISASNTCLNDMDENDVVLIDFEGNLIQGNKKPSSEKIMHSEIYTRRDDIGAIIHCHDPLITAFAVAGKPIDKAILPDMALKFETIPIIPYFHPSTIELATTAADAFDKGYNAVLLKNHGIIVGSDTLQNAFYDIELIRSYVEIYFGVEVLGGASLIPKKSVEELKKIYIK